MEEFHAWMGYVAAIITAFAYWRIIKLVRSSSSTVAPNLASWFVWAIVDGSIFWSSLTAGIISTMAVFGVYTLGCLSVIVLVIKKSKIKFSLFDGACLLASLLAFIAWKRTGKPEIAIYLNLAVAIFGSVPTIWQAWITPEKEDQKVWTLLLLGGAVNILAVSSWSVISGSPPVVVVLLQALILFNLKVTPNRKKALPDRGFQFHL